MKDRNITIEEFSANEHSVDEITEILHRAYSRLLKMGLKFWATTQSPEETLKRFNDGRGFVALREGKIVGTITYYDDCRNNDCEWYKSPSVSRFGQFAVDPDIQAAGIGSLLIETVTELAKSNEKKELALDTSEKAEHLIEYYEKRGFRFIQYMQWHRVNYRSVVMSKKIS